MQLLLLAYDSIREEERSNEIIAMMGVMAHAKI
jgi:hypothetical protein